jgi:hypothetical protein
VLRWTVCETAGGEGQARTTRPVRSELGPTGQPKPPNFRNFNSDNPASHHQHAGFVFRPALLSRAVRIAGLGLRIMRSLNCASSNPHHLPTNDVSMDELAQRTPAPQLYSSHNEASGRDLQEEEQDPYVWLRNAVWKARTG